MRIVNSLALAAALALPFAPMAQAAGQITVTGEATVQTAPDLATISLGVTTRGATAAEAMAANTAAVAMVIERLKAAGIEGRDLQTANLSLNPEWSNDPSASTQPVISSYMASNQLMVRVRALDTLGGVLDAAITDGANTLNGLSFDVAEPRALTDEARRQAVADARAKAGLLATAAGVELGKVVSITEGGSYGGPAPMFRAAAEAAPVPVEAGEIGLTASVTVTWEIAE